MLRGNKGEWSELYTLLKLISDKELHSGDYNLNKINQLVYPIIKIIRDESNGIFEYFLDNDIVIVTASNKKVFRIPVKQFTDFANKLYVKIKKGTASFAIPEIESFISTYNSNTLKARSSSKSDIRIVIHDHRTGITPELGFSIKSHLGGASTLLNAGRTTNFIYSVSGVSLQNSDINRINSISSSSKIKHRIELIREYGGYFNFLRTEAPTFQNNLILIDSSLPIILAEILFTYYTSSYSTITDLVENVKSNNPLRFNLNSSHPYYEYKIKQFLTDIALGMTPSKVWKGKYDATGGYLIVKDDGDIVCYHFYNRNEFEDYLFYNTKLDTASSAKHDFGTLIKAGYEQFFKLNLQVRFTK